MINQTFKYLVRTLRLLADYLRESKYLLLGAIIFIHAVVALVKLFIYFTFILIVDLVELLELAALEDKLEQVQFVYPEISHILRGKCCCFF